METPGLVIVFDMDGVLVDVTESYRETIVQTVRHFSGQTIARALIQDYKNQGGWNNDWALSQKILADLGVELPYATVVEQFQRLFLPPDGLISREVWIDSTGVLERLNRAHTFTVFTGRLRAEAQITLDRFAGHLRFAAVIGEDDVTRPKPHPEGLEKIAALFPAARRIYIGDTLDDARAAQSASVPFIGVGHTRDGGHAATVELMKSHGAIAVIESINQLESVLPA